MKKGGILNSQLASVIAGTGHGHKLAICDSGYPIPFGARIVDVSLTVNIPRVLDTLKVILEELKIEGALVTNEMEIRSPHILKGITDLIPEGIKIQKISHKEFLEVNALEKNITFVKTGEATPFANLVLTAGVIF
ncbi:MAG: D-ribose pyranase [Ignavibacteriales bacterium]|nr:D-ribose pyranase [Ignavibacteriales bacterium]